MAEKKHCKNCGIEYNFCCTNPEANSMGYWKSHCCSPECFVEFCGGSKSNKRSDDKLRIQYNKKTYTVEYDYKKRKVNIPTVGEVDLKDVQTFYLSPHELLEALDFQNEKTKKSKKSEVKED